jgi:ABC-type transport system substrate-binding protein
MANPVEAIEPALIQTNEQSEIATNVFETLLATDVKGTLVPSLCEKWEASDEGRIFRLTLRRGVRFSDGTPLTAVDVKVSFETAIRAAGEMPAAFAALRGAEEYRAGAAEEVRGVVVKSDHELEVELLEPLPIYPALLTEGSTGVVRRAADPSKEGPALIGTGPFRLAAQDPERVILERNPNYWRAAAAPLDAIEFRTGLSATAIARGFRSGEIDLARDLLPEDLEGILRDPRLRGGLVEAPKKNVYFVLFNTPASALARNKQLRRVLAGLVQPQDIVWRTLGRFAEPATGLIPPGTLGHDAGRRARSLTREEALDLLRAEGMEGAVRLKASVHPLLNDRYGTLLNSLFSLWAELGVEVEVATSGMSAYLESWKQNNGLDLLIGRWNADYDDPDNLTHTLFHSRSGVLRIYFSSPEADQVLEEARSESRPAVREAHYRRFENLLFESSVVVPLFHDIDYRLASPKVSGLRLRGTAPYVNYSELAKTEPAEPALEAARTGGGVVHVPIAGVVTNIDPALSDTLEQAEVIPAVFETLTRDIGGWIVPWLAADFGVEEGGRRYRFRLREDARFQDGRRLTARDARYSFERMLQARESESRWFYSLMRGAKAVLNGETGDLAGFRIHSAVEFSIELEEPVAFFPALLSNPLAAIIPEGSQPSGGSGPEACVGTGPFRVVGFEAGRRLELERNKAYWRKGYPRSEGLVFTFGVPPEDMLAGLRDGRFSLGSDLFPADVEALRREPEFAARYRETPRLITYYAAFNAQRGPLADRGLRQQLTQAVDVPKLVRQTLGRLAVPALGLIPPGLLGHERVQVARAESQSSPRPVGPSAAVELTAAVHPMFFGGYAALGRELSAAFAEKGVKVRSVTEKMTEFSKAVTQATVDLAVGRWGADYPDADTFVYLLHSQEGFLGRLCGSPELDRLAERGRAETSPAVRHSLYRQVEEILAREALLLPLFHEQGYRFARPELEGLTVSFGTPTVAYENLRIRG